MINTILENKRKGVLFIFKIILVALFVTSCDYYDTKLNLINTTNDTIYYVDSDNEKLSNFPIRFQAKGDSNEIIYSQDILPFAHVQISSMGSWEDGINSNKDSSIYIFFFKKDLVKKYSRDSSLIKKQLYTKRVKLKVKDLEKLNWNVTYP